MNKMKKRGKEIENFNQRNYKEKELKQTKISNLMKKIKIKIIVKIYKEYQSKKVLNTKTTYNKFVIIKL